MLLLSRDTGSVSLIRATSFERPWSCDLLTGADQFYPMPNILDKGTPSRLPPVATLDSRKGGFSWTSDSNMLTMPPCEAYFGGC
jgi:hypothetical protein